MTCSQDSHERSKRDTSEWLRLDNPRPWVFDFADGPVTLEMRECPLCKSSLLREVKS